jgi:two-component system response regulator YesN
VQDMADRFGVTKNHFCHLFTQHMGVTFITYLNTVRIKAACDMIKKDQDTILEISSKCGFCSSHYFYRVFKKEKGLSPSEYRQQFRTK